MTADGRANVWAILLAGALSMFFAEVLSGSSVMWFVTPFGWLLTFWLYLAHTVLFVNLALRFRRASMPALYLWGVLFGLYEAWITKVAWAGYAGFSPGWGTVLGFAFPEVLIVVFFWHPVYSWILPVLTFEVLGGEGAAHPQHRRWLLRSRRNLVPAMVPGVLGAAFLAYNAHGDALAVGATMAGSLAIIALCWRRATAGGRQLSLESLRLGPRGMRVLLGYLVLLYAFAFVAILPERIAPPLTIVLTVGLYLLVIGLLRRAGPDAGADGELQAEADADRSAEPGPRLTPRDLGRAGVLLTVLAVVFALAAPAAYLLIVVAYLGLVTAGPILLLRATTLVLRPRREPSRLRP